MVMKNKPACIIAGIIFIVIGVFILYRDNSLKKRCTEKTVAVVVGYVEKEEYDEDNYSRTNYYPVIQYNVDGRTIKSESNSGGSYEKYDTGSSIDILYNPNNIDEYIIVNDNTSKILAILFIIAGVLVTAIISVKSFTDA